MQRYFIDEHLTMNQSIQMDQASSHHILKVMRGKKDDKILVVDQTQQVFVCQITGSNDDLAVVLPIEKMEQSVEFSNRVAIACGLSKNDKLEWIVQKGTECGMTNFWPLALKRDVMKWPSNKESKKIDRLKKIAQEASEQSHRTAIPTIEDLASLNQFIEASDHFDVKLIAYEETAKQGDHHNLKKAISSLTADQSIVMIFGSEGGLTEEEVEKLIKANFIPCSLGPRILRAETAPIYFLSALSYQLEL